MGSSGSVRFRYLALHYSKISETLITGFTCPPTIYFKFITKCDSFFYYRLPDGLLLQSATAFFITKCYKCYYKVQQVLQSLTILLQSATGITKCDDYYKVRE